MVSEVSPDDRGVDQNENFKIELYALQVSIYFVFMSLFWEAIYIIRILTK